MTRSAGPALRQLHRELGDRVQFVTLYVREAHPGERVPQPHTLEEKVAHARAYARRDGIAWPVAVDDVQGTLHRALDPKPSSAYLVDARGVVVGRTLWSNDVRGVRQGIEALARGEAPGERTARLAPMLRGLGVMREVLRQAGRQAERDLLRAVPPLYLLAVVARGFRPLPPLARGVLANGVAVAAGLALVGAAVALRRRGTA
ncbi:MAG: hypothetical protein M9894_20635 [Planctomycetes bacterium]|nr:hypothetical protein [Planctomycetota bacterium]